MSATNDRTVLGFSIVSLISSAAVSVYLLCGRKKTTISYRLLIYLSVFDTFAMVFKIVNAVATPASWNCPSFVLLYSLFLHGASMWTVVIGFHILWSASGKKGSCIQECLYFAAAVGLPLIYIIIMYYIGNIHPWSFNRGPLLCWYDYYLPSAKYGYPVLRATFFSANVIILGLIMYKVRGSNSWSQKLRRSKGKTLLFIQICYLLYTVAGLMSFHIPQSKAENLATFIMSQCQGLLNSIVVARAPLVNLLFKFIRYINLLRWREGQNDDSEVGKRSSGAIIMTNVSADVTETSNSSAC